MTEAPIFERLEQDLAREARHVLRGVTDRLHHHGYDDRKPAARAPEGAAMSIVTDAVSKVEEGVTNMESWFSAFKPHVETIAAEIQKVEGSPATQAVLKAIEDAGVPDEWIGLVTDFIAKIGQVAGAPAAQPVAAGDTGQASEPTPAAA